MDLLVVNFKRKKTVWWKRNSSTTATFFISLLVEELQVAQGTNNTPLSGRSSFFFTRLCRENGWSISWASVSSGHLSALRSKVERDARAAVFVLCIALFCILYWVALGSTCLFEIKCRPVRPVSSSPRPTSALRPTARHMKKCALRWCGLQLCATQTCRTVREIYVLGPWWWPFWITLWTWLRQNPSV